MSNMILNIYCDESGTMPIDDSNDIFLTTAIGIINQHPTFTTKCGKKTWLIEKLDEYTAIPFVSYIFPQNGYGKIIKTKFDKFNTMARYTSLMTGANTQYLDKDGIHLPNFIWTFCMVQSIGNVIMKTIFEQQIDEIRIYIDENLFHLPPNFIF